jgi:hypothetical protein
MHALSSEADEKSFGACRLVEMDMTSASFDFIEDWGPLLVIPPAC